MITYFKTILQHLDFIDKTVYEYIFIYANPDWLTAICRLLMKSEFFIPFALVFLILFAKNNSMKQTLILVIGTVILLGISESAASWLKELFGRHRPVYHMGIYISKGGYSFPSAHAVNTMAFAVLWANRMKAYSAWFYSMSIIVGFSRMLANYHFPGDILGGWAVGFFVGSLFVLAFCHVGNAILKKTETNIS